MKINALALQQKIAAGAMAVVFIAAFLPWVSVYGMNVLGVEGDGVITLILALLGLAALVLGTEVFMAPKIPTKVTSIILIVLGALVSLTGIVDMNRYAAIGLYFTLLGGLAWLGVAIWQMTVEVKAAGPAPGQGYQQQGYQPYQQQGYQPYQQQGYTQQQPGYQQPPAAPGQPGQPGQQGQQPYPPQSYQQQPPAQQDQQHPPQPDQPGQQYPQQPPAAPGQPEQQGQPGQQYPQQPPAPPAGPQNPENPYGQA